LIKHNDIRCGNYLFDQNVGLTVVVNSDIIVEIEEIHLKFFEGEFQHPYKSLPLIEEWLYQFEFNYDESDNCWVKKGFKIWGDDQNGYYHINSESMIYFDTVHRLQNYYKALTNKELKI
jgi:hypothetical protein